MARHNRKRTTRPAPKPRGGGKDRLLELQAELSRIQGVQEEAAELAEELGRIDYVRGAYSDTVGDLLARAKKCEGDGVHLLRQLLAGDPDLAHAIHGPKLAKIADKVPDHLRAFVTTLAELNKHKRRVTQIRYGRG